MTDTKILQAILADPNAFGMRNLINISDLRSLLQNFTNIFDYNLVVGNFGSPLAK